MTILTCFESRAARRLASQCSHLPTQYHNIRLFLSSPKNIRIILTQFFLKELNTLVQQASHLRTYSSGWNYSGVKDSQNCC